MASRSSGGQVGPRRVNKRENRASPRAVGAHVEHIYVKVGVRTRAAATLFAVGHALIESQSQIG